MYSLVVIDAVIAHPSVGLKIVDSHDDWEVLRENSAKAVRVIPARDIRHDYILVLVHYDAEILEFLTKEEFDGLCLAHMENVVRETGELDCFEPNERISQSMSRFFDGVPFVDDIDEDEE